MAFSALWTGRLSGCNRLLAHRATAHLTCLRLLLLADSLSHGPNVLLLENGISQACFIIIIVDFFRTRNTYPVQCIQFDLSARKKI